MNLPVYIVLRCGVHATIPQGVFGDKLKAKEAAIFGIVREPDDYHHFDIIRMEGDKSMDEEWNYDEAVIFSIERETTKTGILPIITIDEDH